MIIWGHQDIPQRICISLKKKVQTLIEVGKINFKSSNQSTNLLPKFSRARIEEVEEFATISGGIQGGKIGYTFEKMEEEKKALKL